MREKLKHSKPDDGTMVLLTVKYDEGPDGIHKNVLCGVLNQGAFYFGVEKEDPKILGKVTHWMPYPAPATD